MRHLTLILACILMLASTGARVPERPGKRFKAVDIYVDSGEKKLAAYQLELVARAGNVTIVGVEGGEHPAFTTPPYYDPAALRGGRIILAAFDADGNLPQGRTRVARVHFRVGGEDQPEYAVRLEVAASEDADEIPADTEAVRVTRDTTE